MKNVHWKNKSIETLEQHFYGDPATAPTRMVQRCLELCQVPLNEFTIEDLRLMIGQKFVLQYLIPLAIEHLKVDLFAEGDLYRGDLLEKVLNISPSFWTAHPELYTELKTLTINRQEELLEEGISSSDFNAALTHDK